MQTTRNILLVRPASFGFNAETADSNAFQNKKAAVHAREVAGKAIEEFNEFTYKLDDHGVNVLIVDDTNKPEKPDAIFPNNWVSFHPDGTVILYPMQAKNRRSERRRDIIDSLSEMFQVKQIVDFSVFEEENKFLEGTGSIVFDHQAKVAYACLSPRTDRDVLESVCRFIKYKPVYFTAKDDTGKVIYHTNVMMCVGPSYVVVCLDSITDVKEQAKVVKSFEKGGLEIIDISFDQLNKFAGNMLAVHSNRKKKLLVMSETAHKSLSKDQKKRLNKLTTIIPQKIDTIETIGGGSARCMMAEVFLPEL